MGSIAKHIRELVGDVFAVATLYTGLKLYEEARRDDAAVAETKIELMEVGIEKLQVGIEKFQVGIEKLQETNENLEDSNKKLEAIHSGLKFAKNYSKPRV